MATKAKVHEALREVSNGEGEPIRPGEWAKAKELIAAGKAIDYKGAAGDHNFDENGDVPVPTRCSRSPAMPSRSLPK